MPAQSQVLAGGGAHQIGAGRVHIILRVEFCLLSDFFLLKSVTLKFVCSPHSDSLHRLIAFQCTGTGVGNGSGISNRLPVPGMSQ